MFNYSPKQLLPLINQSLANRILSLLLLASLLLSSCTSTTKIKPVTPTPTLNPLSQSANSYKPPIYSHSKPQTAQRPPKADSVSSLQTQETEPLAFIENVGQFDPRALFQVRGGDATIYLAEDAIWFTYIDLQEQQPNADSQPAINQEQKPIKTVNLKVTFPGSNTHPELVPFDKVNTHLSYVSEGDANSHKNVPVWGGVRYVDIYPGMDLEITSQDGQPSWRFVLTSPARFYSNDNPIVQNGITAKLAGYKTLNQLDQMLQVVTDIGDFTLPTFLIGNQNSSFQISGDEVSILVPAQDTLQVEPAITPVPAPHGNPRPRKLNLPTTMFNSSPLMSGANRQLVFSTYLGGSSWDIGEGIAIGSDGMIYASGNAYSPDFPVVPGNNTLSSGSAYVTKIDPTSGTLIYSAILPEGRGYSVAVDHEGYAYVVGTNDIGYIAKLNQTGDGLVYVASLGVGSSALNSGDATGIVLDSTDSSAYVLGHACDPNWAVCNIYVTKINTNTAAQEYVRQFSGNRFYGGIALAGDGSVVISGQVEVDPENYTDVAFVIKLDPAGQTVYETHLGGTRREVGFGVAADQYGNAYVVGQTTSSDFPVTTVLGQRSGFDGFLSKLDPSGNVIFTTLIGGNSWDTANAISLDSQGDIYIFGWTESSDFPVTPGAFSTKFNMGWADYFIVRLNASGNKIDYGTFLGGSDYEYSLRDLTQAPNDGHGNIYVTGETTSYNFPVTNGSSNQSGQTAFVTVLYTGLVNAVSDLITISTSSKDACFGSAQIGTQGVVAAPINTRTGGYEYEANDLSIPTSAGELSFSRDYSSLAISSATPLGPGWTHSQDTRLILPTSPEGQAGIMQAKIHTANKYIFNINSDGTYSAMPGVCASLSMQAGPPVRYVLSDSAQRTYTFDENGKLLIYDDGKGNQWQYSYDSNDLLSQISADNGSRYLSAAYDLQGRLASITDQEGRSVTYTYDNAGDLTTVTDVLEKIWTYEYDTSHHLLKVTDPGENIVERTEYDSQGRAVRQYDGTGNLVVEITYNADGTSTIRDALNHNSTHIYDARHTLVSSTDALNASTSKVYDYNFRPTSITDPSGNTTSLTWSATGTDLTQIVDANNGQTDIAYDSLHNPVSIIDPQNHLTTFTYNGKLLVSTTDVLNQTTTYTYTPEGFLASTTDPLGHTISYTYDTHGQRISMTDSLSNTWHYGYDSLGRLTDTTDPLERVTHNEYNALGQITLSVQNYDAARPQNDENQYNIITTYEYDSRGNQASVTDTYGHTTQYGYDAAGRLISTIDPQGNSTTNTYDANGNLASTTNELGEVTTYTYDADNRPVSTTDALGNTTHTAYNLDGTVASTIDALGRTTHYDYDALKRVVAVTDPSGGVTSSEYDKNGNLTASIDPLGRRTTYEYDALGRQIKAIDPSGGVTETFYDAAGNRIQTIDPRGNATTYAYDNANHLISVTDALGHITAYEYDALGRRAAIVDANGERTTYTDDALDHVVAVTDPLGHTTQTTYDALGRRLTSADANSNTTSYSYDTLGRLTSQTNAAGGVTSFTYDAVGDRLTTTDPDSHTIQTAYDVLNRAISQTDALGNITTTVYDAAGQVTSTTNADGKATTFGYDNLGRQVSVTDPLGKITHNTYDAVGQLTDSTDANGVVTHYEYDALARLTAVVENYRPGVQPTNEINVRTEYTYDANGNRLTIKDGNGNTTHFAYNVLNQLITETDPLSHTWTYQYDALGHRVSMTDANGQVTQYNYNDASQMTAIDYPGTATDVSFNYDAAGRRTSMTDAVGTTSWSYDDLNRATSITDPFQQTVGYAYDSVGNRTGLTYPGGQTVSYAYDAANRLTTVTNSQSQIASYQYDAVGRLLQVLRANGVDSSYTYDAAGHLTQLQHTQGTDTLSSFQYTYDNVGNRTQAVETMQSGMVGPTVLVTVTDTTGAPLAGKSVYAFDGTTYSGYNKVTDANGQASITLPAGSYRFRVDVDGTQFWSSASNNCTIGQCANVMVTVPQPVLVSVQSTDGTPMSGLKVYAFDGTTYTNYNGITDTSGQVSLRLPQGNYHFRADFNGTQFWDGTQNDCAVPGCTLANIKVTQPVTVSVLDNLGMPHAGITVYAFDGTTYTNNNGTTDANGQVQLTLPQGNYHFRADFNGTQFWDNTQNDCSVPGCGQASISITLPLLLTVQDTDGTPKGGIHVYAFNGSTYTNYNGTTDANGHVSLTLPAGSYHFRADLNGTQFWSSAQNDCTIPSCVSDLVTVTKPLTVNVKDTDGTAKAGLHVYAFNDSTYTGFNGTTDTNGQVAFTLPQGGYRFRADLNGTQFWSSASNDCTLPGCSASQVVVTKPVTVTVQDGGGTPQSAIHVYAFNGTTYTNYSGTSDTNGNVIFTLLQGSYRFRADFNGVQYWSSGSNDCTLPGCGTDLVVVGPAVTPTSTLLPTATSTPVPTVQPTLPADTPSPTPTMENTLPADTMTPTATDTPTPTPETPAPTQGAFNGLFASMSNVVYRSLHAASALQQTSSPTVEITVQDTTNAPKSGLKVYAFIGTTYTGYSGTTDSNGQVIFTLPQGDYRFRADLNGTQFWTSAQNDCTVPSCSNETITVTLPVSITVQDTDGIAKAGLHVYAFNDSTYTGYNAITDSNGQLSLTLPQGNYRFRADLNGTQFWSSDTNNCAIPGCTTQQITVTNPVTVVVQDTDGTAQAGLPVYAFDGTTYTGYNGKTDSNGQVTLTLPQGSYRFRSDLNGTQFWSSDSNNCTLPSCSTSSITVTKPLVLTVQSQTGQPYPNLSVYAFNGTTYTGYNGMTDVNGHVTFTLQQGSYRFRADYDGVQFWSGNQNGCTLPGCTTATVILPGGTDQTTTTIDYTYDPLNRLTDANYSTGDYYHYAYDAVGNRLQQDTSAKGMQSTGDYQYDIANRLTSVNGVNYAWDNNGNLLSDGVNTYTYDSANRLIAVNGQSSVQYAYNGLGDRLQQTVNGTIANYTLDLNTGLTQVLSDGVYSYTYGVGRISQQQGNMPEYFLDDALGSVLQLTDQAGAVVLSRSYDPYGNVAQMSGTSVTAYGFTGEQQDNNINLVYLRSREYDPTTGRFLTKDSWQGDDATPMTYNAWLYVDGNPVNYTDPTGNVVCFPGAIGSVLVGTRSFTVATVIELCRLQYSKTWGLQLYPDNNGIKECPQNDFWMKPTTVTDLYIDWLCERGKENVEYYSTDSLTQELARSAVVASIRSKYYKDRNNSLQTLDFDAVAFAEATLDSAINKRISITHFMGSFDYRIQPVSNGRLNFWISNDTERASGSHFIGRFEPYYRGSLEELVKIHPELMGKVVDAVISQYNVISVLKAKTRTETTGDEGGGKMTQTFTWSENNLGCLDSIWPLYLQFLDIGN